MKADRSIVSVHVPKCSGSSFRRYLIDAFGEKLLLDYDDRPTNPESPMNADPQAFLRSSGQHEKLPDGYAAVHGHFWAKKYENVRDALFITFLREPVQRLLSHFFYMRSRKSPGNAIHDRVVSGDISILDFAALPQMRHFYSKYFFRDFDMGKFDFIGISEQYDTEIRRLQKLISIEAPILRLNVNTASEYISEKNEFLNDAAKIKSIEDILSDDIRFYQKNIFR